MQLTANEMASVLENIGPDAIVALDTEGTNISMDYRDGTGYGIGISIALRFGENIVSGYYPFRHPNNNISIEEQYRLSRAIENIPGWLVMHNAKFDLVALKTLGIDYNNRFYCTLLLCHLLNEILPYTKSLNGCVAHYLKGDLSKDDSVVKTIVAALGGQWHLIPADIMAPYATYDAVLTLALFEVIEPLVFAEVPRKYWDRRQDFIRVIIKMESRGVRIDTNLCNRMSAIGDISMSDSVEILGLNPGSPIDQRKLFLDILKLPILKTSKKTGNPSFDRTVMEEYDRLLEGKNDPTAELVLTYRGWQKSVSSNYKPYVALLSPDGRLRPHYKIHGTTTGRLSCEKPALQQIPKVSTKPWNGSMKKAFIPEEGYTLIEFDYSQLELRLAAAYGNQTNLKEAFQAGRDVFSEMSVALGISRFDCKTLTYSILFGAGAPRISTVFNMTMDDALALKNNWFKEYEGIAKVVRLATNKGKHKGKLQLWSGRYRHLQYPDSEAHKSFNAVIQGGASDIVADMMVRLMEEIDNDDECRMLLQVHDSIVFEIRNDIVDEYLPRISDMMIDIKPDFGITWAVDAHKWGEG